MKTKKRIRHDGYIQTIDSEGNLYELNIIKTDQDIGINEWVEVSKVLTYKSLPVNVIGDNKYEILFPMEKKVVKGV